MTALWMFLAGVAALFVAGCFAAVAVSMGFGGMRSAPVAGVIAVLLLLAGLALMGRALGFGWVGAP